MQLERWHQIKDLFSAALEHPTADRAAFLDRTCGNDIELLAQVHSLLDAHESSLGFIERPAIERAGLAPPFEPWDWQGRRLGNYRIVSELGRGGMSHVYKAVRDDDQYYKEVAIKLLRPGLDTQGLLQRLRDERQMLAELSHPNIAQLLDGGVTETGAPYLVMEYVEGQPIDEYCEERGLSIPARLDLMRTLCGAVHYVHQHLMVHGDLKGGNILVTQGGVLKLLDFGIAKLLNASSEASQALNNQFVALTPAYASPEQIRGEPITTASDVYSLGVLLYKLLAGTLPFEVPAELFGRDAAAASGDRQPRLPSIAAEQGKIASYRRIARQLRGDLDVIAMKALAREPEDRYGSAEHLAEDMHRYQRGFPVHAHPPRALYRTRKLVMRHKAATVASGLFAVAIVSGIVATAWQAHVASNERARAERHLAEIRKLTNTYLRDVYDAAVNLPGATEVRKLLVENSLKHIAALESESQDSLEFKRELAQAYQRFGDVQGDYLGANLGDTEGAVQSYRRALRLREQVAQQSPTLADVSELLRSYVSVSELLAAQSKLDEAIELAEDADDIGQKLAAMPGATAPEHRMAAAARMLLGTNLSTVDLPRALEALQSARATFERLFAEQPKNPGARRDMALIHSRLGFAYARAWQYEQALEHYLPASDYAERLVAEFPADAAALRGGAFALNNIGEVYNALGQPDQALSRLQLALERVEHLLRIDPVNEQASVAVAYVLNQLGDSYLLKGEPATALTHLNRALRLVTEAPPPKPTDIAEVRMLPGMTNFRLGKAHALLKHQREAATFLAASLTRLEPLTADPVVGKDAQRLTEEARQLLQSAS
ncbi:serine/threonine-protein kinase [Peristeroidobacter agariperforans]|uniref:serine/threonine-protein kinase n=1 Tax=Peristeroidobacter agariperforans TaxID=268404 RepID=UPI00101BC7FD|nr:serine/threonine-protein kinase [Peristeroidobacter agariperforans]